MANITIKEAVDVKIKQILRYGWVNFISLSFFYSNVMYISYVYRKTNVLRRQWMGQKMILKFPNNATKFCKKMKSYLPF